VKTAAERGIFVHVNFDDLDAAFLFLSELIKHRSKHFAWPAPVGPELDQHRSVRFQNFDFEILFSDFNSRINRLPSTFKDEGESPVRSGAISL
jgi:hypothetical protein